MAEVMQENNFKVGDNTCAAGDLSLNLNNSNSSHTFLKDKIKNFINNKKHLFLALHKVNIF
jgi:hypothetical protein